MLPRAEPPFPAAPSSFRNCLDASGSAGPGSLTGAPEQRGARVGASRSVFIDTPRIGRHLSSHRPPTATAEGIHLQAATAVQEFWSLKLSQSTGVAVSGAT